MEAVSSSGMCPRTERSLGVNEVFKIGLIRYRVCYYRTEEEKKEWIQVRLLEL